MVVSLVILEVWKEGKERREEGGKEGWEGRGKERKQL